MWKTILWRDGKQREKRAVISEDNSFFPCSICFFVVEDGKLIVAFALQHYASTTTHFSIWRIMIARFVLKP
jgi:hypothetical protein